MSLFERRIEPLLKEDRPSSCNQCHLSGVDLSLFARSTACETMACLKENGLANLDDPAHSRILGFVAQAQPESELITQTVIDAEYDALNEWLNYSAACHDEVCAGVSCGPVENEPSCVVGSPPHDEEVPATPDDCSPLQLVTHFKETVYAWRGRCFPCHFDDQEEIEIDGQFAPQWLKTRGSCNQAAEATLKSITKRGYVNPAQPGSSLLLLKPLGEEEGGVVHGGHDKFTLENDEGFASFLLFSETYAACFPEGGIGFRDAGAR